MPPHSSCQHCAAGPRRGTLAGAAAGTPLARSCWGNVSRETSQAHWALSLALAPSMSLTWSWTAVVTHVSNDSTQLSDQHYATVRRLWLQERDESCDRARSLIWVRDGGGGPPPWKCDTLPVQYRHHLMCIKNTPRLTITFFRLFPLINVFIFSLDVFIFNEHTSRI